jgi:hypothetical protein
MTKKYFYGGNPCDVSPAEGVKGVLIKSGPTFYFRVYDSGGSFTDYDIQHDDLFVTIDADALASFYHCGEHHCLDHSPQVFGLKTVDGR